MGGLSTPTEPGHDPYSADPLITAASLSRLAAKFDPAQRRQGQLIALVGLGGFPHTRPDGVHVIPVEHLGA